MELTKFGHSCILVEEKGKRMLIDPGNFVFMDRKVRAGDFQDIDAVLLTHEHQDHTFLEALKVIVQNNSPKIITNKGVGKILEEAGIEWKSKPGNLPIRLIECPHGLLPEGLPTPENTGFLIKGFFHPGDSLSPQEEVKPRVIALPVITTWATLREVLEYGRKLSPQVIIPVHDGFLKYPDFINNIIRRAWPAALLKGMDGKPFEV